MIEIDSLTKIYSQRRRKVTALDSISLSIEPGEFVAVVGPSGSGKSTLLLTMGGMLTPTSGRVAIDGESIYGLSVHRRAVLRQRKLGFVFQSFNLIPYLTALENVQIPMMLAGSRSQGHSTRGIELLNRMGLGDRMDHKPNELSAGQQQRVALARTLANDPDIILADEPTGNLDPATRKQVMDYLAEFHREGKTIIVITHDPEVADNAERILRFNQGRLESDAPSVAA